MAEAALTTITAGRSHDTASGGENRADLCLWAGCDIATEASQRLARETERETACDGCGEVAAPSSQCKRERETERDRQSERELCDL